MKPKTKKRFGQHFLKDRVVLSQIVQSARIVEGERVLEVGPGAGALTARLLEAGAQVTTVEIDRDWAQSLRVQFGLEPRFKLVEGDVLKLDLTSLLTPGPWKLVANLPYNISTPLFFILVELRAQFSSITVMLQKEVAARFLDQGEGKGLKDYGAPSVVAALCFKVRPILEVPPEAFEPPPKVDSTVIELIPKPPLGLDETEFFRFVKVAFNQRRKLLLPRLKKELPEVYARLSEAEKAQLAPLRPENLKPEDWLRIWRGTP
ncbi:MAG: ribosomal RNA small subunit methyltransferase A [Candidatus Lambdaproteobacteria bacterium RIFOXYD2_FULL_50_16]|uniref:Ribosomal RNA small subunit methyltransferase A n=1 Tax=Candidatus Lambdaproteobacteria bacterium RIFOXYD2_FULL_50_16 TaxID=1817772 RepID=A0A1F6G7P2_9PROT|nr:MAG: ribosomal RNA small subunit methyltransferase A [Candidatus Lambdaproteobacteria bacterium RIFOXYD2_FULL_50_16]